jgi:hypothetical protein
VRVARLPAQKKTERDRLIVADRASGLTWPTIARRHDLSERQCQEIVRARRAERPLFESRDPVEAVTDLVEQLDSVIEKFALVAEQTGHDAVRVGALRSQLAAMEQRFVVMRTLGLTPSLDLVRQDVDLRRVAEVAVSVLRRHGVPDEVFVDFSSALQTGFAWQAANGHARPARS